MIDGGSGEVIDGRFELVERLGSGGMGTVWRARDLVLHREVAVKQVTPPAPDLAPEGAGASAVLRERVLREARALARISDPHVVTIHHVVEGAEGSFPWLVMELVPGGSLADLLDQGTRMEPREGARIGRQVLAALRTAHAVGICHRDVKPANVLLRTDGDAVLTDFGIAALQRTDPALARGASVTLTATGELIGTPEYIAPERIRGKDDDPASDLWSLGIMLYVCIEGHSPMRRQTVLATMAAVLDGEVPPPVRAGALAPVLTELLVVDPAQRPSAERLDAMLAAVAEGTEPTVRLPKAGPPAPTARTTVPAAEPDTPSSAPPSSLPHPSLRRRQTWLTVGAAALAVALTATTVHLVNGPSDDGEGSANPSRSSARTNKLGLWEPGTLKVAVNDGTVPPSDGDTPIVGPGLARALGDQLGLKVELFTIGSPSDMINGLLNREEPAETFDLAMPGGPDDFDRGEEQDMALIHYFDVGYAVVAPWETVQDIRSKEDLCGKNFSLLNHGFVEEAVRKTSTELCGAQSIDAARRTDTLHGYITELPFAVRRARNSDGELHLTKADLTDDIPLGMAVDSSDIALRAALMKALDKLITNGEYADILKAQGMEHGAVTKAGIVHHGF
ncbi:serine/threonine-protein kinase [Streptomyces sp. MMBL 11-1]|uniref:serine/threonine-protein kinase n=1 Tax=Streptomyces sp. MMBL 11-1 TaxID=3026420 RepID=UPI002360734C|nr:serine/threonine-protein kinase [Streptomyces sp. MMBL 11-1]